MSSLLDILQRKQAPVLDEPDASAMDTGEDQPTVELRLAIDNEPTPVPEREPPTAGSPGPAGAPSAPANEAGSATAPQAFETTRTLRPLTASQLRNRSRRGTLLLSGALALIIMAAGLATWLLNRYGTENSASSDLLTAPVASPPEEPAGEVPVARADSVVAAPAAPGPAAAPEPERMATAEPDWYDTPAVDPTGDTGPGEPADYGIRITRGTTASPLFPLLTEAWQAFQAGDYARAEALYREVRAADERNIDALLGLAALAARGGRPVEARDLYREVLLVEPRNAAAISAMSLLPSGAAGESPPADESTLKNLLRDQPGAANLHFALGLQYVSTGRWQDAQVAFFDAVRNDPVNADYAYNLAVSLDHLGQKPAAASYYQRAIDLATASSLFDRKAAAERLASLRAPAT